MNYYCQNFYEIIADIKFRKEFLKNFDIAWPLITDKDLKSIGEGVSFFHITRFAFEKGQNLDTFDTIERIKKKRKNSQEN